MAIKGSPRDMNKWREQLIDPNVHFPGETSDYRRARNQLLEAEDTLRRTNEQVIAQRQSLPAGGLLKEDYVFESAADGSQVRFSEFHLAERINLAVIAKTSPDRLRAFGQERGWHDLRLLSSRNNTFNRDYRAERPDGGQLPVLQVFSRNQDGFHHHWSPEGRGDVAAYPNLQY